jgi:hypothetical protein
MQLAGGLLDATKNCLNNPLIRSLPEMALPVIGSPTLHGLAPLPLRADTDVLHRSEYAKNVEQPQNNRNNHDDVYNGFNLMIHRYISIDEP